MELKFNGKAIEISQVTASIFKVYLDNAVKNTPASGISGCFADAYKELLKARLGGQSEGSPLNTKAGIASGRLRESIAINKLSQSAIRNSEYSLTIKINQRTDFLKDDKRGFYTGGEFKQTGYNKTAVQRLKQWIISKKGRGASFDYSKIHEKDKDLGLARVMLYSWVRKGTNRKVLPKWYDIFKNGTAEPLKYLFKNKNCIETNIKKILHG